MSYIVLNEQLRHTGREVHQGTEGVNQVDANKGVLNRKCASKENKEKF